MTKLNLVFKIVFSAFTFLCVQMNFTSNFFFDLPLNSFITEFYFINIIGYSYL